MKDFYIVFSHALQEFRLQELHSVCDFFGIKISYDLANIDLSNPFLRVQLDSDEDARKLGSKMVQIRYICEYWANGSTYDQLFGQMQDDENSRSCWQPYAATTSFKFIISAFNATIDKQRQRQIMECFAFMEYRGPILLKNPDIEICVDERWPDPNTTGIHDVDNLDRRIEIWAGRKICNGQRELVDRFDLKKRVYIGNTSMAAELSLIMANQAQAGPGKLVYDPFVGTGSMLYTSAWFGATVFGSDIDGRHIRGKNGKSVFDSAAQYGVRNRVLDCLIYDLTQNPLRMGGFVDAIVTDPPYGVRAGAKRLGKKDDSKLREEPYILPDGTASHESPDWVPSCKPWEMSEVLVELLKQALHLLKPGGRLVYWLPTITSEYQDTDVPQLKGLRLIANSEQDFGKWARRLITMEKIAVTENGEADSRVEPTGLPAHFNFRTSYFNVKAEQRTALQNGSSRPAPE